jgi:antitoxin component of RelBE/YafQ-DinJ toxin-antitoxin module
MTVSAAVQSFFEHIAKTGVVPLEKSMPRFSREEAAQRLARFNALQLPKPCGTTDDEIKEMRLKEKYGLDTDA